MRIFKIKKKIKNKFGSLKSFFYLCGVFRLKGTLIMKKKLLIAGTTA